MMTPCLAVIEADVLAAAGFRTLLGDLFFGSEIIVYPSVEAFIADSNRYFVHFFVRDSILFAHTDEFSMLKDRTFVLSTGPGEAFLKAGFRVIDTTLNESAFVKTILQFHAKGHPDGHRSGPGKDGTELLSGREKEILALIVRGLLNKEIADRLGISVTTVIFHRNKLCAKLGTRSIGRLTIYAVLSGLVDMDSI